MGGLKAKLTQKIGPLPAFAWVLILVGGYLAYRKLHSSADSTATTDATTADTGIIGTGVGGDAGTVGDGTNYHEPVTIAPGDSLYDTNTGKLITAPTTSTPDAPVPDAAFPATPEAPQAPAAQTVAAPHPAASPVLPAAIRPMISAAIQANSTPLKIAPVAAVITKVRATSPAVSASTALTQFTK